MSKRKARYQAPEGSLRAALEQLPDVRRGQGLEHPLGGVLALAVCAVLCGARSQYAVSQWGQDCGPEIRAALGLKRERGPSGPTIHRVFRQVDHAAFEQVLGQWFTAQGLQADEAIATLGKTLRGIHGEEVPGVHLVAAFAHQTRTVLAQAATGGKGHELVGVKAVLASLPARRFEWTRGDWGCAVGPARPLPPDHRQRGDSCFVLKENQPLTLEAGAVSFADPFTPRKQVVEGDRHGDREERRTLEVSSEVVAYLGSTGGGCRGRKDGRLAGVGPGVSLAPRSRGCQWASSGGADERVGLCAHQPDACTGRPLQTAPHLAGTVAD